MDRHRRIEIFLQAAHRLAVSRLRDEPVRIGEVPAQLLRWRKHSGHLRSDPCWDEWERLLKLPIDEFEREVCADGEHATVLRSVSPVGVLISEQERSELLQQVRGA